MSWWGAECEGASENQVCICLVNILHQDEKRLGQLYVYTTFQSVFMVSDFAILMNTTYICIVNSYLWF